MEAYSLTTVLDHRLVRLTKFHFGIESRSPGQFGCVHIPKWYMMMWTIEASDTYIRRQKRIQKDHPKELGNALEYLNIYFKALCAGAKPMNIRFGWLHDERKGLFATDQGRGKNLTQLRLYFYPDIKCNVLWLLTIDDKRSQQQDILDCRTMVSSLPQQEVNQSEQPPRTPENENKG